MEFLKRPVAPYFVAVPDLEHLPSDEPVVHIDQPPLAVGRSPATATSRVRRTGAIRPPSPRIVEVLALESPTVADLSAILGDPDPGVRRTSVSTLVEHLPDGYAGALLGALGDGDHRVRIEAVRALVSVDDADGVAAAAGDDNREVRIAAANGLSTLRAGVDAVRRLVGDSDPLVRAADEPGAREALGLALEDGDADVRPYARHALTAQLS